MNVQALKCWIGRSWSKGKFTDGINNIKTAAKHFLLENKKKSMNISTINVVNSTSSTPTFNTPESEIGIFFLESLKSPSIFPELSNEILINSIEKEVDSLRALLLSNNNETLNGIKSTRYFWLKNIEKYPLLSKLAEILLNINSSSACIERYFSICGVTTKKYAGNTNDELLIIRSCLRANIEILKKMNKINNNK